MNTDWLRTLVAIVDEGSFEAAADELGVSASAVSQRVRALEKHVGQLVVQRTLPCRPTPAGEQVLRMARQVVMISDETMASLRRGAEADGVLRLAVNADSLATWFRPVLAQAAGWPDVTLRLELEDQDHSARLLRRGDVVAVVTSDPVPVQGCRIVPLGAMTYVPVAAAGLVARHGGAEAPDWAAMPALRYNAKDGLQLDFLRQLGITDLPRQPQVPGSEAFLAGVEAGLGWGMIPVAQLERRIEDGRLVRLPGAAVDVALHWQVWSIDSPRIERLGRAVREAAAALTSGRPVAGRPAPAAPPRPGSA